MSKKLIFLSHDILSDTTHDVNRVLTYCRQIALTPSLQAIPMAPYLDASSYLKINDPAEYAMMVEKNAIFFEKKIVDELWVCGPKLSENMKDDIRLCLKYGVPVKCYHTVGEVSLEADVKIFLSGNVEKTPPVPEKKVSKKAQQKKAARKAAKKKKGKR